MCLILATLSTTAWTLRRLMGHSWFWDILRGQQDKKTFGPWRRSRGYGCAAKEAGACLLVFSFWIRDAYQASPSRSQVAGGPLPRRRCLPEFVDFTSPHSSFSFFWP